MPTLLSRGRLAAGEPMKVLVFDHSSTPPGLSARRWPPAAAAHCLQSPAECVAKQPYQKQQERRRAKGQGLALQQPCLLPPGLTLGTCDARAAEGGAFGAFAGAPLGPAASAAMPGMVAMPLQWSMEPMSPSLPMSEDNNARLDLARPECSAPGASSSPPYLVQLVQELQEKLRKATEPELAACLQALLPAADALACDANGHGVVEDLLERGTAQQRLDLVACLRPAALRLATDAHGCWVLQKAIQLLPSGQQAKLFAALAPSIEECMESRHGNFVVQACIEQLPPDDVTFVAMAVEQNPRYYASHKYGCRVVQRLLEHCPVAQVAAILDEVVAAAVELSRNQYGCHVLRCVLEHGRCDDKRRILEAMRINIVKLSRNRLASMVIEKCIEVASDGEHAAFLQPEREAFTLAVLYGDGLGFEAGIAEAPPIEQLARTRFGRGILRRFLDAAPPALDAGSREALRAQLQLGHSPGSDVEARARRQVARGERKGRFEN